MGLLSLLCISTLLLLPTSSSAQYKKTLKNSEGLITDEDLTKLAGVTYHSVRYEPICGTLGAIATNLYTQDWDVGGRCPTAMTSYLAIPDPFAFFDRAGVRLEGDVVGQQPACMCFSLGPAVEGGAGGGHFCLYFDETGQLEETWSDNGKPPAYDRYVATSFKRKTSSDGKNVLPQCTASNVESLKAAWSATATGREAPLPPQTGGSGSSPTKGASGSTPSSKSVNGGTKDGASSHLKPLSSGGMMALGLGLAWAYLQ